MRTTTRSAKWGVETRQVAGSEKWTLLSRRMWSQFATYRTYWRDDPDFDCAHTLRCWATSLVPIITDEVLLRLCAFAVETRFGWPRRISPSPEFCVRDWVRACPVYVDLACKKPGDGQSGIGGDLRSEAVRLVLRAPAAAVGRFAAVRTRLFLQRIAAAPTGRFE